MFRFYRTLYANKHVNGASSLQLSKIMSRFSQNISINTREIVSRFPLPLDRKTAAGESSSAPSPRSFFHIGRAILFYRSDTSAREKCYVFTTQSGTAFIYPCTCRNKIKKKVTIINQNFVFAPGSKFGGAIDIAGTHDVTEVIVRAVYT